MKKLLLLLLCVPLMFSCGEDNDKEKEKEKDSGGPGENPGEIPEDGDPSHIYM